MTALAVGLMSGTSADGVDAALVRIDGDREVSLVAYHVRPYTHRERDRIRRAIESGGARDLAELDFELGEWFAQAVQSVLDLAGVASKDLSFISSHGHTIWHEPGAATLQLGEAGVLAERFGVQVVSDFRGRDVAAGGQGAPLVPLVDVKLFAGSGNRVLLNIGGMANLTWIPAPVDRETVLAFDTGPGMSLVDAIVREHFRGEMFDEGGILSGGGTADQVVVENLLGGAFFKKKPPKSTGRELFGDIYARGLCSLVSEQSPRATANDFLATAVELTARSITDQIDVLPGLPAELVISGGGARNLTLLERLRELNAQLRVKLFGDLFFDGDAKEAVSFAYLGLLSLEGEPGNLPAATGAAGPRVLGKITPA